MERKAHPKKAEQGQQGLKTTAGKMKLSGLNLNVKSAGLKEKVGQQRPTAQGQRWGSEAAA